MMRRVLCNYIKFLIWDLILIIAFALAFYTLFHGTETGEPYKGEENFFQFPFMSLFRTLIMLMGEFDISSIPFDIEPLLSYAVAVRPRFGFVRNLFKRVFLFPNSLPNKELRLYPNLGQKIMFFPTTVYTKKKQNYDLAMQTDCFGVPTVGGCCKMDPSVIKSAMDIIDKKGELSENQIIDRLDNIEKQVQNIVNRLNEWFSQSPEE
ncbi:hypothetical protein C0J52_17407 [Blattella germanica]|nr:hypothetical protein C0J52_17407 [Blattella germanica]